MTAKLIVRNLQKIPTIRSFAFVAWAINARENPDPTVAQRANRQERLTKSIRIKIIVRLPEAARQFIISTFEKYSIGPSILNPSAERRRVQAGALAGYGK